MAVMMLFASGDTMSAREARADQSREIAGEIEIGVVGERGRRRVAERRPAGEREQERRAARRQRAYFDVEMRPSDQRVLASPISAIGPSSCSPLFIAQIVTIGYGERTISTEGCRSMRMTPDSSSGSSAAKLSASSGVASAA